jgi:hypothetical protein
MSVDRADATSSDFGLLQMEADHRAARRIATMKIYLLLLALIGVPLAALIRGFIEIIRQDRGRK